MRMKLIISVLFITAGIFISSQAQTIGLGGYTTGVYGHYEWDYSEYGSSYYYSTANDIKHNSNGYHFGGGFILDTALAQDRLFNYRLHVGISFFDFASNNNVPDIYGVGFHCYHSFGFGIIRTENLRIWLGPQAGIGFLDGDYDVPEITPNEDNSFLVYFGSLGFIMGVNINFGTRFTLAFDGGFRFSMYDGDAELRDEYWEQVEGNGYEAFVNISFLFRFGDTFPVMTGSENISSSIRTSQTNFI